MGKHAFLIMAHNQFKTLEWLIASLDDPRNDIFIHFDKKVKSIPTLNRKNGKLIVLKSRVNVIWGDVSQIKAEYVLFKSAFSEGEYDYYHLISGTHFPLCSQDEIHSWYDGLYGQSVLKKVPVSDDEVKMRFGLYHYFLSHLVDKRPWVNKAYHFGWRAVLSVQKKTGIHRDTSFIKGKASQWCSLTEDAVKLILESEKMSMKRFSHSFCCDEFFVMSVIEGRLPILYDDRICFVKFINTTPKLLSVNDYDELISSGALFARKMSDANADLCERLFNRIVKS